MLATNNDSCIAVETTGPRLVVYQKARGSFLGPHGREDKLLWRPLHPKTAGRIEQTQLQFSVTVAPRRRRGKTSLLMALLWCKHRRREATVALG